MQNVLSGTLMTVWGGYVFVLEEVSFQSDCQTVLI